MSLNIYTSHFKKSQRIIHLKRVEFQARRTAAKLATRTAAVGHGVRWLRMFRDAFLRGFSLQMLARINFLFKRKYNMLIHRQSRQI